MDGKSVPVVGYTGFIGGKKSQNLYGKNFRTVAIDSKIKNFEG